MPWRLHGAIQFIPQMPDNDNRNNSQVERVKIRINYLNFDNLRVGWVRANESVLWSYFDQEKQSPSGVEHTADGLGIASCLWRT